MENETAALGGARPVCSVSRKSLLRFLVLQLLELPLGVLEARRSDCPGTSSPLDLRAVRAVINLAGSTQADCRRTGIGCHRRVSQRLLESLGLLLEFSHARPVAIQELIEVVLCPAELVM